MGWGFKSADELFKPSSEFWVTPDPAEPSGFRPRDIADDHAVAARLALNENVPEPVRDYFDATRMLWVYGYVYHPFFSMAAVHAGFCIELALREKFRRTGTERPKTLARMLRSAVAAGWLIPEAFTAIRNRNASNSFLVEAARNSGLVIEHAALDESPAHQAAALSELIESVRELRNMQAHPEFLTVMFPNMALAQLQLTHELVLQLFGSSAKPGGQASC